MCSKVLEQTKLQLQLQKLQLQNIFNLVCLLGLCWIEQKTMNDQYSINNNSCKESLNKIYLKRGEEVNPKVKI